MSTHPASTTSTPVTVIGLGMMGTALAHAFLSQGHPTTVWNRSPGKTEPLTAQGATGADTVGRAVSAGPLVVVCLSNAEAVHQVLEPEAENLKGRVLVNLTSSTPEEARTTAAWAQRHGIDYLDGAIMAIPPLVGQPQALIFYGGSSGAYSAHEQTLRALGGATTYLGEDTGLPSIYDSALLGILWSTVAGNIHALALVGTEGVTAEAFLPYATAWLNHVAVPYLPRLAQEVDRKEYATEISTLNVNREAIAHLVSASRSQGVSPELLLPVQALIERRVARGHGSDSLSSLIEELRNPSA
ncbi:3-hydroxyisobutyrate dehydrogenase [Streptomyces spinoverrucosus]|uniref:3-hydroxyisobutyrate dehydrogenase n=1 Tax=Streptomyces spinoverrucosus TaxID=284043 RepID=A0A4Y3VQW8_9ACTN|nr:NAD(P)-binding domain-containing protein [Streptomyces spinoverrucosus]GEC08100.1 3-hydroxyisobutyrate dehydrogenase [Streptomyces spinoverrucosus]GHB64802.1 3-hydroxyisobutyrate dehydrogenase [Streptomyces spinoverrucosus]